MGNYLDAPDTKKDTFVHTGDMPFDHEASVVECAMRGWRREMEDFTMLEFKIDELPGCSLIGVFDGHGGHQIAIYAGKNLRAVLVERVVEMKAARKLGDTELLSAEDLGECLRTAFLKLDRDIKAEFFTEGGILKEEYRKLAAKQIPVPAATPPDASEGAATPSENPADDGGLVISGVHSIDLCGTAPTVALMTKTHFIVANCGDTQAVGRERD